MSIVAKFKPKDGAEFELFHVLEYSWGVGRATAPNGQIAQNFHSIDTLTITRQKSLKKNGKVSNEPESVKLAGAVGNKAYFSGSIVISSPDDESATVQTIRWDEGQICGLKSRGTEHGMLEIISVAVGGLKVDDTQFKSANGGA